MSSGRSGLPGHGRMAVGRLRTGWLAAAPTFLGLLTEPAIQAAWLCLLTVGALVPERPRVTSIGPR
ncbi:MAG: hypothetical protein ACR2HR_12480 [Euzebya sp.]